MSKQEFLDFVRREIYACSEVDAARNSDVLRGALEYDPGLRPLYDDAFRALERLGAYCQARLEQRAC